MSITILDENSLPDWTGITVPKLPIDLFTLPGAPTLGLPSMLPLALQPFTPIPMITGSSWLGSVKERVMGTATSAQIRSLAVIVGFALLLFVVGRIVGRRVLAQ